LSSLEGERPSRHSRILSPLVGTQHGHIEITGRQDIENAIVLALALALMSASYFCGELIDRRLREATTEMGFAAVRYQL
jgi:hypothetical protein